MDKNFSILVNSSDGYEDCWVPYFHLLKKYWPSCQSNIYLNTESKNWVSFDYPDLICTQVERASKKHLTWSECLLAALDKIETPLVLYFQEDYFIHQPVRHEQIQKASDYMLQHPDISHVALSKHCSYGPYGDHVEPWLQVIPQKARYRISTQAGLWRVDALRSYLNPVENGWMFEIFGTWRAHKRQDTFLSAKWDAAGGGPVIDYLHTGIIKGKWLKDIQYVFADNNIQIDFQKRGFYEPKPHFLNKLDVAKKLLQNPRHMLKQLL